MERKKLKLREILPIIIALVINLFIVIVGTIRTNYSVSLKGGLTSANKVITVDTDNEITGSYSTVYVISFSKSTILQNFICQFIDSADITEISSSSLHFSDLETYRMGVIQHNSSVQASIISAFNEACLVDDSINIDYSISSLVVTYYYEDSNFKIGDEIIEIDGVSVTELYANISVDSGWLMPDIGSILTINRDDEIIYLTVESSLDYIYCYPYFDIDYDTISPSVTIKSTYTTGPSGGFIRALSLYDELLGLDLSKGRKIAGTGTISQTGAIGSIGSIKQKIYTAASSGVDIFLCPSANYEEALEAYNKLNTDMILYEVSSLSEAISLLS